jgi:hypothetical protein
MSERSLGDAPPVDEPEGLDPKGYDVRDYAVGIRPGRRSVTIEPRPGLMPELQALVEQINAAPDDADVDALVDEFDRLKSLMRVTFTLERRSQEWIKDTTNRVLDEMGAPRGGMKDVKDGTFTEADSLRVTCSLILGQTVEVSDGHDWTVDELAALYESAPEQVDALAGALIEVNAAASDELTLDFSQRRSTSRGTRRSSTN